MQEEGVWSINVVLITITATLIALTATQLSRSEALLVAAAVVVAVVVAQTSVLYVTLTKRLKQQLDAIANQEYRIRTQPEQSRQEVADILAAHGVHKSVLKTAVKQITRDLYSWSHFLLESRFGHVNTPRTSIRWLCVQVAFTALLFAAALLTPLLFLSIPYAVSISVVVALILSFVIGMFLHEKRFVLAGFENFLLTSTIVVVSYVVALLLSVA
ncbi:MAG: VIT1/CCC1 transporter family protein [Candidatus Woesearchaeota archaeon]